ncbi:hypothetical protein EZS27_017317 [termite gut metagenome]|uniref:Rad50/SbcC-type AAA domain-containing protein n=1 Tax=termite gut metagenome TaxID=433724 RepID=A0A5J4RLU6_9ZZZZ
MKKINNITFKNFKAFFGEEKLTFEGGKNLLLYGENGSGKSSIYWGLYTFLQSSGKKIKEISKYFANFDNTNPVTYESLKNVFSSNTDDSFIELETIDENQVTTRHKIQENFANTNLSTDKTIALANASSDFIHYKLLYNFYDVSHKHELNLWKVFMRDIFPYFRKAETDKYYSTRIEDVLKGVPMSSGGKKVSRIAGRPQTEYVHKIDSLNNDIQKFIYDIETNANEFLKSNFYNDKDEIKIELNYDTKIDYDSVRYNQKNKYKITLFVKVWDENKNDWITIKRPQSFLNEAILTRIAFCVRIGAFRTRLVISDYKILCLDDLLISLDMGNRDKIIQIILNTEDKPSLKFFDDFQKLIFTHDKAFFNLCKQRINLSRKSEDWIFKEMYWDTDIIPHHPFLDNSTDYFERAEKHLKAFDYPAAANALRQGLENLIFNFLPDNERYMLKEGITTEKTLEGMLTSLKKILKTNEQDISMINNLFVYKDHLLNPLSHNNIKTPVYKEELKSILNIIPLLQKMKSNILKEITSNPTVIKFIDISTKDALTHEYFIEIKEHVLKYTLLDGKTYLNKIECIVTKSKLSDGSEKIWNQPYRSLQDCARRIAHYLGTSYSDDVAIISKLYFS